jgi:hypothetical protein
MLRSAFGWHSKNTMGSLVGETQKRVILAAASAILRRSEYMIIVDVLHGETRICTQPWAATRGRGKDLRPAYGHASANRVPWRLKHMLKRKESHHNIAGYEKLGPRAAGFISGVATNPGRKGLERESKDIFECSSRLLGCSRRNTQPREKWDMPRRS